MSTKNRDLENPGRPALRASGRRLEGQVWTGSGRLHADSLPQASSLHPVWCLILCGILDHTGFRSAGANEQSPALLGLSPWSPPDVTSSASSPSGCHLQPFLGGTWGPQWCFLISERQSAPPPSEMCRQQLCDTYCTVWNRKH